MKKYNCRLIVNVNTQTLYHYSYSLHVCLLLQQRSAETTAKLHVKRLLKRKPKRITL